jgi:hypothetical protein
MLRLLARLMECGSVPMISGWSHRMWIPSQIMWADMRPQSQSLTQYSIHSKDMAQQGERAAHGGEQLRCAVVILEASPMHDGGD